MKALKLSKVYFFKILNGGSLKWQSLESYGLICSIWTVVFAVGQCSFAQNILRAKF